MQMYNQAFADYDKTIALDSTNSVAYLAAQTRVSVSNYSA